jgi:hypothetical protein
MPTVYIETTIPSSYYETRTNILAVSWRAATRLWWDRYRSHYDLCTSTLTLNELADAPEAKRRACMELMQDVDILPEPKGLAAMIDHYVGEKLMPAGAGGDAGHLAYATLHNIDFLLTWNCSHLANANKMKHLQVINTRLRLSTPILTTPFMLVPESDQ